MSETSIYAGLLDGLTEPALLLREGRTVYFNHAAAKRFPGLETEAAAPAIMAGELLERRIVPEGELLLLHPLGLTHDGLERRLPVLLEQVRQQVNVLLAVSQLMAPGGSASVDPKLHGYLSALNHSAFRLLRLAEHGNMAEALADDALVCRPAPLDLAGLCQSLADEVASLSQSAGLRFLYECEMVSLLTMADAVLLRQLVLALISNALTAAGSGGEAGLKLSQSGDRALLTIWDSGAGLDLAALEGDAAPLTPNPSGALAVGLPLARKIAALHGGAILMENPPGRGLKCTVSLPIHPIPAGQVRTPPITFDPTGGFSPVLVELSNLLPSEAFSLNDLAE